MKVNSIYIAIVLLMTITTGFAGGGHVKKDGVHVCTGIGVHARPIRSGANGRFKLNNAILGGHGRLWFNDLIGLTGKGEIAYERDMGGLMAEFLVKPRNELLFKPYFTVGGGFFAINLDTVLNGDPYRDTLFTGAFTAGMGVEGRLGEREKHGIAVEVAYVRGQEDYYHTVSDIGSATIDEVKHTYNLFPVTMKLLYTFYVCNPEPVDTDKDGFFDEDDQCPLQPEDKDGFQDNDGCPEWDNDVDGIPDTTDKCVMTPEDFDSFEDEDGCPETDNDKDGILDVDDSCPNEPEDFDGFKDEDGCPEPDNDEDGFLDAVDSCPLEPETANGYRDEDGCPDERPKAKEITREAMVLDGVNFESGKAILKHSSYVTLDKVVESLLAWFEVSLEVQGHTDAVGSAASNEKLSQARAEAVRDYFLMQGIAPERVRAVGYGEEVPVADNETAAGRAENRRVELHRID